MRFNQLVVLLGFTTAAVVSTQLSVRAATSNYQIESGTTSLSFDTSALNLFTSLGVQFNSAVDTVTPAQGFELGFSFLPPSSNPSFLGTDFTFSYDNTTGTVTPVSGTIEHSGSLVFDVDTTKLALLSPFEVGNFSIGFDGGYFLTDKFSTGARLFDLKLNSNPTLDVNNLQISNVDLLISQEFNNLLSFAVGVDDLALTGTKLGSAQIDAKTVPEPGSALSILIAASAALAVNRRRQVG